jgi:hypothetical protein
VAPSIDRAPRPALAFCHEGTLRDGALMTKRGEIVRRIERALGAEGLAERLAALPQSDLTSLLLEVVRRKIGQRAPAELLAQHRRSALLQPGSASLRELRWLDEVALQAAEPFAPVELSPLGPLGASAVLGGIDPDSALAALRGAEVLADPTTSMALLAAERRAAGEAEVRLCASARALRMQALPADAKDFTPHFRLFALATAARVQPGGAFEAQALLEHASFHLRFLHELQRHGCALREVRLDVSDAGLSGALASALGLDDEVRERVRAHRPGSGQALLSDRGVTLPEPLADPEGALARLSERLPIEAPARRLLRMRDALAGPIAERFPQAELRFDLSRLEGAHYYVGPCFRVTAVDATGARLPLSDGGALPWTQRLLGDRKERFFASGIGIELLAKRFARGA